MKKFLKSIDFEMLKLVALVIFLTLFILGFTIAIGMSFLDSPACFINDRSVDCRMHKLEVCIDLEKITKEECLLLIK